MHAAIAAASNGADRGLPNAGGNRASGKDETMSATASAVHSHQRSGPAQISAAAGTGSGSHGSRTTTDNQSRMARDLPAATAMTPVTASVAASHHVDGRTPTRAAAPASPALRLPNETQSASPA